MKESLTKQQVADFEQACVDLSEHAMLAKQTARIFADEDVPLIREGVLAMHRGVLKMIGIVGAAQPKTQNAKPKTKAKK